jgi:hypothetical protein
MFGLGTRPAIRRKHFTSPGNRRRLQDGRAAYRTRLRIEALEERRLLAVFTVSAGRQGDDSPYPLIPCWRRGDGGLYPSPTHQPIRA